MKTTEDEQYLGEDRVIGNVRCVQEVNSREMPDWLLQAVNTRQTQESRSPWSCAWEGFLEMRIALDHTEDVGVRRHRGGKKHT